MAIRHAHPYQMRTNEIVVDNKKSPKVLRLTAKNSPKELSTLTKKSLRHPIAHGFHAPGAESLALHYALLHQSPQRHAGIIQVHTGFLRNQRRNKRPHTVHVDSMAVSQETL